MGLNFFKCEQYEIWDSFIDESPQGSIFAKSIFLRSLGVAFECYFVAEGDVILAGAVVLLDKSKNPVSAPYSYTQYQGVFLSPALIGGDVHRKTPRELSVIDCIIASLSAIYSMISFCIHPSLTDVRAFQWFNYHSPGRGCFNIRIAYSGIVDLSQFESFDDYLLSIRPTRRSEYKKALKLGFSSEVSNDIDALLSLYKKTFFRQGIEVDDKHIRLIGSIIECAQKNGYGEIRLGRDVIGRAVSATFFLFDNRCAYYLIGANDPEYRTLPGGVYVFLESVRNAMDRGVRSVDVCGMNSPNRGDYKSSFNAQPVPYFLAEWNEPN